MSVTLVTAPDRYALTRGGRMRYVFTGSGRYQTLGTKAVTGVNFFAQVADGTKLTLRWNGQSQVLTARANPTGSNEFPTGDGSLAYADSLVLYFRSLFAFRRDFIVSRAAGSDKSILFTARKPGVAYTITQVLPAGGIVLPFLVGQIVPGGDPLLRDRYGVYLEVYLQKPGTLGTNLDTDYALLGDGGSHVECDADGVCEFDLGDLLHSYLGAELPNAQGGQVAEQSHRRYYVAYGEAYGQPVTVGRLAEDEIRHAYLGGADFIHRSGVGYSLTTAFLGATPADDRALRLGSPTRVARIEERHYLSFVNLRETDDQVSLQVALTLDDNTTQLRTGIQAVLQYEPGAKLVFAVGISALGLLEQVPEGKFLKEYSVQLQGQTGLLSRAYRFVVDYDQRPYRRQFIYLNSLGAFDAIMTWGKGSRELQRFYEQAERTLPSNYAPSASQFVDINLSRQVQIEVASGWQPLADLLRWDDFYTAPLRFAVDADRLLAIGLTDKQIKQQKDGDTTFAHVFTYVFLHRDEFFSDDFPDAGETLPPIESPAGSVLVLPPLPVLTRDPTVPDSAREVTPQLLAQLKLVAERPNPETLGYLTQQSGAQVFRRADLPIAFAELVGKPYTRDGFGLSDVLTVPESLAQTITALANTVGIRPRIKSWTTQEEPQ